VYHGKSTLPLSGVILKAKPESFYGAATASYPLGTQFALFGKLGLSHNRVETGASTKTDTRAMAGVGVSYPFTQTLSGVVEYEHFGKLIDKGLPESNVTSIGLRSSF
jgi:OOP family OmpA-OmpF porin